jgi:hypothetical protein
MGRRASTRDPKRRILIVCEGEATEPGYFKAFQHEVRNRLVHVEVSTETGVPRTVVEIARRLKNEAEVAAKQQHDQNLRWDEVWGVFDVDAHPKLDEARELAKAHAIELAISNPCFELWALLHFQDQRAHIERHKARAALQCYLRGYDKVLDFRAMAPGYPDAARRALELDREAERHNKPGCNPTTGVYRLTESIRREFRGVGTLQGAVTDAVTMRPLAGVVVTATSPVPMHNHTVTTDMNGCFCVHALTPGTYALRMSAEGYRPYTHGSAGVRVSAVTCVNVKLVPGSPDENI